MLGPDAFSGQWTLSRQIDDRHLGQDGIFSGTVQFIPRGAREMVYEEKGTLHFGRAPAMQAERRYLWRFEASEVDVRFEDGRDFHRFVPMGQVAGTDHPCGDDFYTVAYDFSRWPQWQAVWTVRGPRKDYTAVSNYIRP